MPAPAAPHNRNVVLVNPNSEIATALPTLIRGPGLRPSQPASEARASSPQAAVSDVPAVFSQNKEISTTISIDDADIVSDSVSTSDTVTKTEVAIDIPASSSCDVQSFTNEQKSIARVISAPVVTDDYDTKSQIANNRTPPVSTSATRSTTSSTNSVNDANSTSTDHPSESAPSDELHHPSILPDEFFFQCVFCFNEFEEADPMCLDVTNGSNTVSTTKDSESKKAASTFEPSIITPCGHRFHIECLRKDCELILKKKKKATTTQHNQEFLMQCPHPFCHENISKSWALENGLFRMDQIQNENNNENDNHNEVLEELNQRIVNRRRIELLATNREDIIQRSFFLRNYNTIRRAFHVWFCFLASVMIAIIVFMVSVYV